MDDCERRLSINIIIFTTFVFFVVVVVVVIFNHITARHKKVVKEMVLDYCKMLFKMSTKRYFIVSGVYFFGIRARNQRCKLFAY